MFRSVASKVSALSSCVANGHQTMHHVSSSPSKIPYGGFSPVRLQTGRRPQPSPGASRHAPRFICGPSPIRRPERPMRSAASHRASRNGTCVQAALRSRPGTVQSRGPWLARGLCCPAGSSLTMASSEPLDASRGLIFFVRAALCPLALPRAWNREGPHFPLPVCPPVPPPLPRWTRRVLLAVSSPPTLAFTESVAVRHPLPHTRRFSRGLFNEAAEFASCCGPVRLLALHRQGHLRSSLHLLSRL